MYKIAICDDEKDYINKLEKLIRECASQDMELSFCEFTSGNTLLQAYEGDEDVIFLDIQMDEPDGNKVAAELKRRGFSGLTVQCSGIYHPTPETIVIAPYRYIQKNDGDVINKKVISEILCEMKRRKFWEALLAECGNEKKLIRITDIAYIVRHRRGSGIYTVHGAEEGQWISKIPFEELKERLKDAGFGFPHNSYIVNMNYITSIQRNEETFELAGRTLTMARSKKGDFIKEFVKYANTKYRQ